MKEFSRHMATAMILAIPELSNIRPFSQPTIAMHNGTKVQLVTDKNGLKVSPHKNTWKRKNERSYIVCVEYFHKGQTLLRHVEPWVNYPSDHLIAKLMLLPREVNHAPLAT